MRIGGDIFSRTEPEFLYFRVERTTLYRLPLTGHFEIWTGEKWKRTSLSEQDWDHLRALTEEEAAEIAGNPDVLTLPSEPFASDREEAGR